MTDNENGTTLEDVLKAIREEVGQPDMPLEIEVEDEPPSVEVIEAWVIATRPYIDKIIGIYPSEEAALEKMNDLHYMKGTFHIYKAKVTVWFDPTE